MWNPYNPAGTGIATGQQKSRVANAALLQR
jgi:hypothetical protein